MNFEGKGEWLRENISLPNSSCLISESFSSSNSLKIGSEWESKVDLEIILITRFCKNRNRWPSTLVSSIDLTRFYRFHRFILEDTSVLLFKNWFHSNSEFVDNGVSAAIESRRIKQFIITFLIKSLKKSCVFFKTRFRVFWQPILARFVGAQFFHDLDLPPFRNNISSACSYLPE